jgi:hypothetical protein
MFKEKIRAKQMEQGDSPRFFSKIGPIRSDFFSILNFTYVDTMILLINRVVCLIYGLKKKHDFLDIWVSMGHFENSIKSITFVLTEIQR